MPQDGLRRRVIEPLVEIDRRRAGRANASPKAIPGLARTRAGDTMALSGDERVLRQVDADLLRILSAARCEPAVAVAHAGFRLSALACRRISRTHVNGIDFSTLLV